MSLADFTPFKVDIKHRGETLVSVRGLGLDDLSILVRAHLVTLNRLFDQMNNGPQTGVFGVSDMFLLDLIGKAPDVCFDVIALACDEMEYSQLARKLPAGLQVKILREVITLTLEDIGGPKALMAVLDRYRQAASPILASVT